MYVAIGQLQLHFDIFGIALLALSIVFVVAFAIAVSQRRTRSAAYLSIALVVSIVATTSQAWVVRPEVWVQIANVYSFADPTRQLKMAEDLRNHWGVDNIRVVSWVLLAERWGLCHEYWQQSECRLASKAGFPMGYARDFLANIANGA